MSRRPAPAAPPLCCATVRKADYSAGTCSRVSRVRVLGAYYCMQHDPRAIAARAQARLQRRVERNAARAAKQAPAPGVVGLPAYWRAQGLLEAARLLKVLPPHRAASPVECAVVLERAAARALRGLGVRRS